jgi:hypothetical protein
MPCLNFRNEPDIVLKTTFFGIHKVSEQLKGKQLNAKVIFPLVAAALFTLLTAGCASQTSRPQSEQWNGKVLQNDLVELHIVPQIGGRVIQYKLADHPFFWVNPDLVNTTPPKSGLGPDGEWLNYGGAKLWPAPQGWDSDAQWPGPPDAVLDGGPYNMEILSTAPGKQSVRLSSAEDKRSGISFSRVITLRKGTTCVEVNATMTNIDNKPRRWGIWDHIQFDAANRTGTGANENFRAYCPLNPNSKFPRGYDVQYGLVNNPSFKPDYETGLMQVQYRHLVGKAGVDSPAGWVATVDDAAGYVFVHLFEYEPEKPYPDNSSVEFWMNGTGQFAAWGKINTQGERPEDIPYVMESEIISPYAELQPGQAYTFSYKWAAARIPENSKVVSCSNAGVTCQPLTAELKHEKLNLTGTYGVFHKGSIRITLLDARGNPTTLSKSIPVSPLKPLDMAQISATLPEKEMPPDAVSIAVDLTDTTGKTLGRLAQATIANNK